MGARAFRKAGVLAIGCGELGQYDILATKLICKI